MGKGEGEGGLNRDGGLINFPPLKRGGFFERGGLIEDLRYIDLGAKSEALFDIYSFLKENIKLSNTKDKVKTTRTEKNNNNRCN